MKNLVLALAMFSISACQITQQPGGPLFRFVNEKYIPDRDFKALAATELNHTNAGFASAYYRGAATPAEAASRALDSCKDTASMYGQYKTCRIMYLGNVFVWDEEITPELFVSYSGGLGRFSNTGPGFEQESITKGVPISGRWEGVSNDFVGLLSSNSDKGSGNIEVSAKNGQIECKGGWRHQAGKYGTSVKPRGVWNIACNDGRSANGSYESSSPGNGSVIGQDVHGNTVKMIFGGS
jgi:hypothetical protein